MSAFILSDEAWARVATALISRSEQYHGGPTLAEQITEALTPAADTHCRAMRAEMELKHPGDIDECRKALALLRLFLAANREAVAYRYGKGTDAVQPETLTAEACRIVGQLRGVSLHQAKHCVEAYKTLQCLHYQCSEDVRPGWREIHAGALAALEHGMQLLAASHINASPFYEAAPWG